MNKALLSFLIVWPVILTLPATNYAQNKKPNIIIIYVDDLGYGDIGAYGATGVKTPTMATMLKRAGYNTAVIGKWHLGLGSGNINWNEEIKPGPREIGFNYSFLIPATGDRVPTVYVENQKVVNLDKADPIKVSYKANIGNRPTGTENPELLKMKADLQHSNTIVNGVSRIGFMAGGESALWKDEDFPLILTQKAKDFMSANKETPF